MLTMGASLGCLRSHVASTRLRQCDSAQLRHVCPAQRCGQPLQILCGMLEEDAVTEAKVEALLSCLVPPALDESPAASRLARAVLRQREREVQPVLQRLLTKLLTSPLTANSGLWEHSYAVVAQVCALAAGRARACTLQPCRQHAHTHAGTNALACTLACVRGHTPKHARTHARTHATTACPTSALPLPAAPRRDASSPAARRATAVR